MTEHNQITQVCFMNNLKSIEFAGKQNDKLSSTIVYVSLNNTDGSEKTL